jgi:hypothetical protein
MPAILWKKARRARMFDKHKKLEEDIAAFPYPVFGLRESVYDLEYVDHYEEKGWFTICYQSSSR